MGKKSASQEIRTKNIGNIFLNYFRTTGYGNTVTYQVAILLKSPTTSEPRQNCFFGQAIQLTENGNEMFCICDKGYFGETCNERVENEISLDGRQLHFFGNVSDKLRVPGMFDLMESMEKQGDRIISDITSVVQEESAKIIETVLNETSEIKEIIRDENRRLNETVIDVGNQITSAMLDENMKNTATILNNLQGNLLIVLQIYSIICQSV